MSRELIRIIENLENMIGKNAKSSFGIVLLTPDDVGSVKDAGTDGLQPRARLQVLLHCSLNKLVFLRLSLYSPYNFINLC